MNNASNYYQDKLNNIKQLEERLTKTPVNKNIENNYYRKNYATIFDVK